MNTKINHINLPVGDPTSTASFFEQVLGYQQLENRGNGNLIVLGSAEGFVLTFIRDTSIDSRSYPGSFHLGVLQQDRESVLALFRTSQHFGYECVRPTWMRTNTFGFYLELPDNIQIEISALIVESDHL